MADGIVIVDKPTGWTSHDVVARARRILRERRIGHTGTLDPFATGVLVLLVGRATRLAQFLAGAEKEYEATMRLGFATDTGDLTGERRASDDENEGASRSALDCTSLTREQIEAAIATLRGDIEQVPPMYSAKKVGGKKLYELARRGEQIERKAVQVCVSEFEMLAEAEGAFSRRNDDGTCDVRARVICSAGTYVRALAESVGDYLGTGAHLSALRRTRAGAFRIEDAFTLDELEKISDSDAARDFLIPLEAALPHLPSAHLTSEEARRARHGAAIGADSADASNKKFEDGANVLLLDETGGLIAVGAYDAARSVLQPRVMLAVEK